MPGQKHIILAAVLMLNSAVQSALGQVARLPESVQKRLAEIGPVYQTDIRKYIPETQQLFAPLLAQGPKAGVTVAVDQQYGPDVKQRLDVYQPANAHDLPVVIFFHGGALTSGDKNISGEAYANVLYYFARNGFLGLNATYRLAPKFAYPSGAQDVGGAVKWAKTNARRFGGDPQRIYLIGHSSGATHAATWAYDSNVHGPAGPGVAGIVLLSGRLRADNRPDDPNGKNVEAYFGTDTSLYAARSPVTFGARSGLPTFIVIAEYDNPFLDAYGAELFASMCRARGKCPRFLRLVGHNHISMVASFNTADDELGREIIDFIGKGR
jgi:acetyl esterase/lipase